MLTKARPAWQAGKLNAIGGHAEAVDEFPIDTQIREFWEETGCQVVAWTPLCRLVNQGQWEVNFFAAFGDYPIRTMTDEPVDWYNVEEILNDQWPVIPNLKWLIPMALQGDVVGEIYVNPALTHQDG